MAANAVFPISLSIVTRVYLLEIAAGYIGSVLTRKLVKLGFKVKVLDVRVSRRKGKAKRFGAKRNLVIGSGFKKVFVKLGAKEKIDLFETSKEGKKK